MLLIVTHKLDVLAKDIPCLFSPQNQSKIQTQHPQKPITKLIPHRIRKGRKGKKRVNAEKVPRKRVLLSPYKYRITLSPFPPLTIPNPAVHTAPLVIRRHGFCQLGLDLRPPAPAPAPVRACSSARRDAGEVAAVVVVLRRVPAPGRRLPHRVRDVLPWSRWISRLLGCKIGCWAEKILIFLQGYFEYMCRFGWFLANASNRLRSSAGVGLSLTKSPADFDFFYFDFANNRMIFFVCILGFQIL